jgi:histidinol phosphatase-like PHP family hydrolase
MKIKHDFHIHTRLSICAGPDGGTYDAYMEQFKKEGLTKVGFTDHYWDENLPTVDEPFYAYQNTPHVLGLKREIESKPCIEGIDVFFGAEVEYDPLRHDIALTEKNAEVFDFIVVPNSHTQMTMPHKLYFPYEKHRDFMIEAYEDILNSPLNKKILSMAHPFAAVECPYDRIELLSIISDGVYKNLFEKTAKKDIAVEINASCARSLLEEPESKIAAEYVRMFTCAKEAGAKFTFGSDAHRLSAHDNYVSFCQAAVKLIGLTDGDIAKLPQK